MKAIERENHGFCRITAATPIVAIGNVAKNLEEHIEIIKVCEQRDDDIVVFPELSLTGYTCEDLFYQKHLQEQALDGLRRLALMSRSWRATIIVGLPVFIKEDNTLRNCAAVVANGRVIGIVPKTYLPSYREFFETRWFAPAKETDPAQIDIGVAQKVPFGDHLLFCISKPVIDWTFGVEICEDVWAPIPPSTFQALGGATMLFNLSASNETIGKSSFRRDFVKGQSGKCVAAYIYCSAGATESTKDLVFGGHNIIGEDGNILEESAKFALSSHMLTADIDVSKLSSSRAGMPGTFTKCAEKNYKSFCRICYTQKEVPKKTDALLRNVDGLPFVPKDVFELNDRCAEIFGIQTCGLAKRIEQVSNDVYIGVSGGLDSTLALLVACKTYDMLGIDRKHIHGITMPGFGTSTGTKTNADKLMEHLGISSETIDIRALCVQTWKDMGHCPFGHEVVYIMDKDNYKENPFRFRECVHRIAQKIRLDLRKNIFGYVSGEAVSPTEYHLKEQTDFKIEDLSVINLETALKLLPENAQDLVFENVQARVRTLLLMSKGFVLGTGDMSELALGFCTYNGDHMSMYNVNCSIPKTLVKFLVKYIADFEVDESWNNPIEVKNCLYDIIDTPISPELLPAKDGEIGQETESIVGPYELTDFFLYNFIKGGFSPEKILFLAKNAVFSKEYTDEEIEKWLTSFYKKFFTQQFKRDCVPAGPKVGSVSLSPRGDWRMPSDADGSSWSDAVAVWGEIEKGIS